MGSVPAWRRRPVHPGHRLFATSRTRATDATAHPTRCEPFRGLDRQPSAPAHRSRRDGASHRTNDLDGDKHRCTLKATRPRPLT
jgi:hypothetical protein